MAGLAPSLQLASAPVAFGAPEPDPPGALEQRSIRAGDAGEAQVDVVDDAVGCEAGRKPPAVGLGRRHRAGAPHQLGRLEHPRLDPQLPVVQGLRSNARGAQGEAQPPAQLLLDRLPRRLDPAARALQQRQRRHGDGEPERSVQHGETRSRLFGKVHRDSV